VSVAFPWRSVTICVAVRAAPGVSVVVIVAAPSI
jgi:hypothetical protein